MTNFVVHCFQDPMLKKKKHSIMEYIHFETIYEPNDGSFIRAV